MDDLLLQTVVEKLEDIELLVKQNNQNKTGEELKKISEELKELSSRAMSAEKINELIKSLTPRSNKIEHRHHLHKGIWIALFVTNIFLLMGWINNHNNAKQFRETDYKYRALKTIEDETLKKVLSNIDSLYKINSDFFEKKVIEKEEGSKKAETVHKTNKKNRVNLLK
jgi:predicted type IV restriction endonuclease